MFLVPFKMSSEAAEAWASVAKFPNQTIVETIGEYMAAYKAQLADLGTSFEHMSIVAR